MYFKELNEKNALCFARDLLKHYKKIDNNSIDTIYNSNNVECRRNNTGWYRYENNEHRIFINIPNIMYAKYAIERGEIGKDEFYAFLALCVGHEYRHFLQGRCIYDGKEFDGYGQHDVFNSELMLYVRFFFDSYYLLNKGNVKYEIDAEIFSILNGVKYLEERIPNMNAKRAFVGAVNFYGNIQRPNRSSTLPWDCHSIDEIITDLSERIRYNRRNPNLVETLFVHNPNFYQVHERFGLDEDKVLTDELIDNYRIDTSGSSRDLLVVKKILSILDRPLESLADFPKLRKRYSEDKL